MDEIKLAFENFCADYGYDTDSRSAEKTYKAVKADVKRADVFREAARLALGDKLDRGAAETEAARLAKRRELAIAQPTRARGESRPQKTGDDIDREIAAVLEEKFPG